jgi:hypothetical protein
MNQSLCSPIRHRYAYIETACGDGIKADNEIGIDCGLTACGKTCPAGLQLALDEPCDANTDCKSNHCEKEDEDADHGICTESIFSCHHVKQKNKDADNGYYEIAIDDNWRDFTKVIKPNGKVEVLCHFYDGKAFTHYETVCSQVNAAGTTPYRVRDKNTRHPQADSKIGRMFDNNPNVCARMEVRVINSIFKHSQGYVMHRWNNNQDEYHVTDIYGTPENGKHILSNDHDCSDKKDFNYAFAARQGTSIAHNGFCFKQGRIGEDSNCICNDKHTTEMSFNTCAGGHGNMRRYNGKIGRNTFCRAMCDKCKNYPHGHLGDSYGCDLGFQGRTIQGHFWMSISDSRSGAPCRGYNTYGCYGSRWIA